jgi:hypothetical protein
MGVGRDVSPGGALPQQQVGVVLPGLPPASWCACRRSGAGRSRRGLRGVAARRGRPGRLARQGQARPAPARAGAPPRAGTGDPGCRRSGRSRRIDCSSTRTAGRGGSAAEPSSDSQDDTRYRSFTGCTEQVSPVEPHRTVSIAAGPRGATLAARVCYMHRTYNSRSARCAPSGLNRHAGGAPPRPRRCPPPPPRQVGRLRRGAARRSGSPRRSAGAGRSCARCTGCDQPVRLQIDPRVQLRGRLVAGRTTMSPDHRRAQLTERDPRVVPVGVGSVRFRVVVTAAAGVRQPGESRAKPGRARSCQDARSRDVPLAKPVHRRTAIGAPTSFSARARPAAEADLGLTLLRRWGHLM